MKFIYASELTNRFNVFGHYYQLILEGESFSCRSSLDIVSKNLTNQDKSSPDAVVIMMNPGSSRPLHDDYLPPTLTLDQLLSNRWDKEMVASRPDNAQYQIMRLMLLNHWQHVRIINLSDLRNGNSSQFLIQFKKAKKLDAEDSHCLTHKNRHKELQALCPKNSLVIAAWGSVNVLRSAATTMLKLQPGTIGLALEIPWYRFASPYRKDHKLDWLKSINTIIHSSCSQG